MVIQELPGRPGGPVELRLRHLLRPVPGPAEELRELGRLARRRQGAGELRGRLERLPPPAPLGQLPGRPDVDLDDARPPFLRARRFLDEGRPRPLLRPAPRL